MKPVVVMTGVAVGWIVFSAAAETNYWIATSGTGNWNEPANWSLDRVPGAEDTVIITNAATTGNGYTVEIDQAPVNVFRVTCSAPEGQMLTLNVRTNLTVNNNSSSDADWSFGPKGNVAINIHSNAELDAYCQILGAGESNNYTVLPGGTLRYGRTPSKRFRVYGSLTVQGSVIAGNRAGELIYANPLILDGGYLFAKALSSPPELVTNNASLSYSLMRIAGMTVTMRDGTVTNRADDALHIGNAASGNASAFLNLSGGLWWQEGPAYICERPNGYLDLSGTAQFVSTNNVWVGSNNTGTQPFLPGYSGFVTVHSGNFCVTNSDGSARLYLGNITPGYLTCAGGTSSVDRLVLSNRGNVLGADAVGRITMAGGRLDILQSLSATNGSYSVLACSTGTLNVANADVANDSALVIGDGKGEATLGLLSGTHRFADGLVITNNATLSAGGVGNRASAEVTGNLALAEGATLHCDFQDNAGDSLSLAGKLTLPTQAAVTLTSLDGTLPQHVVLVAAEALDGAVDLSGWTVASIGEIGYRVAVEGASLVLLKKPKGMVISVL